VTDGAKPCPELNNRQAAMTVYPDLHVRRNEMETDRGKEEKNNKET